MATSNVEIIRLDLPATYFYLSLISTTITEMLKRINLTQDPETLIYNMQLAAHEVCTNIVDHAYTPETEADGRIVITFTLSRQPASMTIDFYDTGRSFDLASIKSPNLDEAREEGYGLFLIHHLMDQVTYTPNPGGNHWSLVKNF